MVDAQQHDLHMLVIRSHLNMNHLSTLQDFEDRALNVLTLKVKNYYLGASGAQETTKLNADAFKKYVIIPKLLRGVSQRNISTEIFGEKVSMPVGISPTALQKWAHLDGELASAKAAEIAETIFIHSSYSSYTIEEVAKAAPKAKKWQQLAIDKNRELTLHIVRRAEQAGFKAIVVTVDYPTAPKSKLSKITLTKSATFRIYEEYYLSKYPEKDLNDLFSLVISTIDDSLTWKDVSWLKSITELPIVVKGVLTASDALEAVNHGANAILVSNHGGRQLESPPTTIEALPEIVAAVGDKVEIYVDGGVRQGTDVFKALALGAKMAFVGRPILWGLACGGQKGVQAVLELLHNEIDETFASAGCRCVKDVTKESVKPRSLCCHL